ncbi:MAG TPA: CBS domain-containing protein [Desulfobacteria bacterium]|nr:CBS domain-containing protein [Desulfobacteria bacterium]
MLVKDLMTRPVITVQESTTVGEALEMQKRQGIRHLPVISFDQSLLGIVSESDLVKVFPIGKDLSPFEVNLLSRTPVSKVMRGKLVTIAPQKLIEEAALIMRTENIGSLPVADENGKLVGIVTKNDIMDAVISALGLEDGGMRITIAYKKKWGFLAGLIEFADKRNVYIDNLVTFDSEIVIKIKDKASDFINDLKKAGYDVIDISYLDSAPKAKAE